MRGSNSHAEITLTDSSWGRKDFYFQNIAIAVSVGNLVLVVLVFLILFLTKGNEKLLRTELDYFFKALP